MRNPAMRYAVYQRSYKAFFSTMNGSEFTEDLARAFRFTREQAEAIEARSRGACELVPMGIPHEPA